MTLDVQPGIEATGPYGPRELFRQLWAGVPSVQLIRLGEFNRINAAVTVALASLALFFVEMQVRLPWLYAWFCAQLILIVGMLLYLGRQKGHSTVGGEGRQFLSIKPTVLIAALAGGLWGCLTAFFPVVPAHLETALLAVILASVAGGSATLASVPQAAIVFVFGCAVPPAIYYLTSPGKTSTMLALMIVVYSAVMISTSLVLHRALWRQLRAEQEARDLRQSGLQQRIANLVNVSESVDQALQSCLDEVCRYTGWPVGHVFVAANDGTGEFVSSGVLYSVDEERYGLVRDLTLKMRVQPGVGMTGYVLESGQPLWSADGEPVSDEPFTFDNSVAPRRDAVGEAGLRNYLALPVMIGQQPAAILEFSSTDVVRPSRKLMDLLVTIATELGRAIERQSSQTRLLQSEEKFRTLIESSAQGMVVHLNEKFLYVNEAGARSFGYTVEEFLEIDSVFDVVHPRYRARMAELAGARLAGKDVPTEYEFDGIHKDGHLITLQVRSSVIGWQGQSALLMTSVDITQRKQAEHIARREERRARDYLNIAGSVVVAMDTQANLTLINRAGCRLLKCEEADVKGKNGLDLFLTESERQPAKDRYADWMQGNLEIAETFVGRFTTAGGDTRDIRWQFVPLRDDLGNITGSLGSGQDMTEQMRVEAQLQQAQKMEAVGQLTSGIAHDFNNILLVVMGNLEIALAHGKFDQELLSDALDSAQHGADLNRQLLTFSKQQILDARTVDVNEVLNSMSGLLKRALGEAVRVNFTLHDEACFSKLDPAQLESAILNLALNARDATPGGGQILVETGIASSEKFPELAAPMLYILIRDYGSGMEPHLRDRAIEPFFTTKKGGSNSGLGLSMVFTFVQRSGGRLEIDSVPNEGTSVYMLLPLGNPEQPLLVGTSNLAQSPTPDNRRILLVEDQEEVCIVIRRYLESLGYQVLVSANGEDALCQIEGQPDDIDMVLSDVVLPGSVSGPEIIAFVKRSHPSIKTILISGNAEKANRDTLDELSNVILLRKPFRKSELSDALMQEFVSPA